MTLDNLPLETEAVITTVGGEGALRCRFLDMGLIPKTKVVVKKIAAKKIEVSMEETKE